MSEVDQIDNVMTLEDLFLSAEFGKTVVEESTPVIEPLFWETSPGAPLLPLAAFPSTTGTHGTTTHMRRNRAFATASGVAAVLLVAVGVLSGTGRPAKTPLQNATGTTTTTTTHSPGHKTGGGTGGGGGTSVPSGGSQSPTGFALNAPTTSAREVDFTGGGGGNATEPTGTGVATPPGATKPATTTPSTPSATAPSGTILSPVISLLGHVVVPVGNTVTGLGGTLTTALPPLAPVTSIVSGLGNTLSLLGNNLIVSAA